MRTNVDRLNSMIELLLDGLSYRQIGERFGVSRQRVEQLLSPPRGVKQAVKKRASGRCEMCGIIVCSGAHLHHVNDDKLIPSAFGDMDNIKYLCPSCHRWAHWKGGANGLSRLELDISAQQVKLLKLAAIHADMTIKQFVTGIIIRAIQD